MVSEKWHPKHKQPKGAWQQAGPGHHFKCLCFKVQHQESKHGGQTCDTKGVVWNITETGLQSCLASYSACSCWVSIAHVEDPRWILGSWCQAGQLRWLVGIWGMSQWMEKSPSLCLSLYPFQKNKNYNKKMPKLNMGLPSVFKIKETGLF